MLILRGGNGCHRWDFFVRAIANLLSRDRQGNNAFPCNNAAIEFAASGGRREAAMPKKKRHLRVEIASKLAQANDLATQGKLQSEIAPTLGVSVMTLYRWRKAPPGPRPALVATHEAGQPNRMRRGGDRIAELQVENSRLRRLVTDLLLEKIKLEEATQSQSSIA
jgi:putative transposase